MQQPISWAEHFKEFTGNPTDFVQGHWPWLIVILVVLFMLSRLNNYMEVEGVNKAIYLTRGIVGSIIAFIIAPIVFLLVLNLYAWFNGLKMFDMTFLWDWFKLTISTFFWLLQSIGAPRGDVLFDTNSLIRLAWVILPLSIIWLRVAVTNFWRLMLIPAIAGILMLTAYKEAKPTFLNKYIPEEWQNFKIGDKNAPTVRIDPSDPSTYPDEDSEIEDTARKVYRKNAPWFTLALLLLFAVALSIGFLTKYKLFSLIMVGVCFGLFFLMNDFSASGGKPDIPLSMEAFFEDLCADFERSYERSGESVETYKASLLVRQQLDQGIGALPENYCADYSMYFYDLCH
ncbi:MAG: hypothetical protein AAF598_11200 [Bacteroidota bacterium]